MQISGRQRQILELLLNRKEEITAGEIAEEIKVSVRTVHRELVDLELILSGKGAALQKKSGKGIQLQVPEHKLNDVWQLVKQVDAGAYSSEERKLLILTTLLQEAEPLKLFSLAHDLGVTVATISHDLDELDSWILKHGLQLVRRRGYGVEITGPEAQVRNTICDLAENHLDASDLFGKMTVQNKSAVTTRLLALVGKPYLLTVEAALWQADEKWLNELPENEYTDLLLHITVAVNRIRQRKFIELHEECGTDALSEDEKAWLERLSDTLQIAFSDAEACHLAFLFEKKKYADADRLLPENKLSYQEIVQRLTLYLEERLRLPFTDDRSLRQGLVSHLETALQRLKEGAIIRNPLLPKIKKDYAQLFRIIRQAVNDTMPGVEVPDEEIGFLVMHFGASIERLKQIGPRVKAIIVCTSGIGSSKMLAVRVQKELPQIDIVSHVSWFEASRIPEESYDLIISTLDLPIEPQRYIKLSPLLTNDEAEKLRDYIRNVTLKRHPATESEFMDGTDAIKRLYRLQTYLNQIVRLIEQFQVYQLESSGVSMEQALREACEKVVQHGGLSNAQAVVQSLLERQKASSQVIPDTEIALFHTRSEHITKPCLTLFRLTDYLTLDNDHSAKIKHFLLMLAPRQLSEESLTVLSEISSFLLKEEMVSLLETGSQHKIQQYLSQQLTLFLTNIN